MPTVDDLINAIGRAEGWGVTLAPTPSGYANQVYNPATQAPFGLRADAANYPQLLTDPKLAYDWIKAKITGQVSPYVTQVTGVTSIRGTYIPGFADANGNIDMSKLAAFGQQYSPPGTNPDWLPNVQAILSGKKNLTDSQSAQGGGFFGIPGVKSLADFWRILTSPGTQSNNDAVASTINQAAQDAAKKALPQWDTLVGYAVGGTLVLLAMVAIVARR